MKRAIFADGVVVGLLRCIAWPFVQLAEGNSQPLLDNPERGCSSGCTAKVVVYGCPVHSPKERP